MKLENQVCTYEQAKVLYEYLGYTERGLFVFLEIQKGEITIEREGWFTFEAGDHIYPAYTVAELGVMLGSLSNQITFDVSGWLVNNHLFSVFGKTQSDAYAQFLFYCIKNGIITPSDCISRLKNA